MSTERERLAAEQLALMRALVDPTAPVPPGFDAERVRAAGNALGSKRMRAAGKAWPRLSSSLGASFSTLFEAWARDTAGPDAAGPHADAAAFGRALLERGILPDDARLDLIVQELHAGARVKLVWLAASRTLVLGLRVPWSGVQAWAWRPGN